MSEPREIKEIAFSESVNWSFVDLQEVYDTVFSIMADIPAEYRDHAKFSSNFRRGVMDVVVSYRRVETDAEVTARDLKDTEAIAAEDLKKKEALIKLAEDNPDVLQVKPEIMVEVVAKRVEVAKI